MNIILTRFHRKLNGDYKVHVGHFLEYTGMKINGFYLRKAVYKFYLGRCYDGKSNWERYRSATLFEVALYSKIGGV